MRVAIFDFDGTLYKSETFQLMMDYLKEHPDYHQNYGPFYRAILPPYIGYKLKLYPERRMKERSMEVYIRALKQLTKAEIDTYFAEMAAQMEKDFNEQVLDRLREHQEDGVHTMLVSGAFIPLLKAITDKLSFDHIIGTSIPFRGDRLDSSSPIYHIQGERKTEKIQESLKGKDIDWENSFAYGDSFSDLPVLQLVGHPIAVKPDKKLEEVAQEKGWQIL